MKTILIYWDAPGAKTLADEFRAMHHKAQIRNPRLFDGVCERADIVCVESIAAAPHVVAAYEARGVEIRDLSVLLTKVISEEEAEEKAAAEKAAKEAKDAADAAANKAAEEAPKEPPAPKLTLAVTQPNTTPTRFDTMSDDELRAFINEAGKEIGVAAHPRAGRAKLIAQAKLLDQKVS